MVVVFNALAKMKNRKGITLIEILVTVVFIALVIFLAKGSDNYLEKMNESAKGQQNEQSVFENMKRPTTGGQISPKCFNGYKFIVSTYNYGTDGIVQVLNENGGGIKCNRHDEQYLD